MQRRTDKLIQVGRLLNSLARRPGGSQGQSGRVAVSEIESQLQNCSQSVNVGGIADRTF